MNAPAVVSSLPTVAPAKTQFNLTPQTLDDALHFAELLCKSSIVPKDYQGNAGNVLVAMQWGMELGLQPLQAMQSIAVINGRPSIWGDAMIALVRASGLMEAMREDIGDDKCVCYVKRRGEPEASRTFTVEDAKKAGLWGKQGPWQTAPKRMLQMRARAFALRDIFPDVLRGMYVGEEAADMPRERDITAESDAAIKAEAPKSRTEAVRAKLESKKIVTLDQVLGGFAAAMDEAALVEASKLATKLQDVADKDAARDAYKARKAALANIDTATGEVQSFSYAQVRQEIESAKTDDERAVAVDMIRLVADEAQRAELRELAQVVAD